MEKNEITQEDVNFEAAIDRYLNFWDMRRNENDCINRILNKIEKIENIWSIYEVKTTYVPIKGLSDEGEGIPSYEKIEFVENKKFEERYKKIVKETELNCEEDEIFEKKLKGYANFVHRKINIIRRMCSESQKMMAVKLIFWNKRIIDFEDRDVKTRLFIENKLDAF